MKLKKNLAENQRVTPYLKSHISELKYSWIQQDQP